MTPETATETQGPQPDPVDVPTTGRICDTCRAAMQDGRQEDHVICEHVHSTAESVREALIQIAGLLEQFGVSEADRCTIEVVLAECMNNVVEHAYYDRPDGLFHIGLCQRGDGLLCRIEDHGTPMPGLAPPDKQLHDLTVDLDDLPEGGFGWSLIRELTQDLQYEREGDCNRLSFRIALEQAPEEQPEATAASAS